MAANRSPAAVIVRRDGRWLLVLLSDPASCELDSPELASFIGQHRLRGSSVVVAVDAPDAYLVSLPIDDEANLDSEDAIGYAIESELPIDAESMVVANHRLEDRLICNVVDAPPVWQCVDALEQAELRVQHIVVESLLWLQFFVRKKTNLDDPLVYSPVGQDTAEIVELHQGVPISWSRCRDVTSDIEREVAMMTDADREIDNGEYLRLPTHDWNNELVQACKLLLSGKMTPWFELRRGQLASHDPLRPIRSSIVELAIAAATMLIILIATLTWQTMQFKSASAAAKDSIRQTFQDAFPGQRIPTAIVKRIRSEHTKGNKTRQGERSVSGTVRRPVDAYDVLSSLIAALPEKLPFQVKTIRISDGELQLDVELDSLEGTAQITQHLEEAGFKIDPPSTQTSGSKIKTQLRGKYEVDGAS